MKTTKLNNLTFNGEALSRAQLKEVRGGAANYVDLCGVIGGLVCDWTCDMPNQSIHLGEMACFEAEAACPFGNTHGNDCSGAN
ncbi:hypothetical protein [Pedobacter montanisoli]|uniref:Bacteriocin n=1 Tax=Pedobacter montanisoli TaxID=2923277 RepID=A0ABS9ZVE7_9SPHI|nr:hypothetical protein [Pedobacter montanisoli]MCJ0742163.1 hypothetical protein [Pedobacter montanisoli]